MTRVWFAVVFVLIALRAEAVTLGWNLSPTATGYKLYYGLLSGIYPTVLDAGPSTQVAIGGLNPGTTYVAAATAYNAGGESGLSSEVSWVEAGAPVTPVVTITNPTEGSLVTRKSEVTVQVEASLPGGVNRVAVLVNEDAALCVTGTFPYACLWRVPPANRRTYYLQAQAWNPSGDSWPSAVVTVTSQ